MPDDSRPHFTTKRRLIDSPEDQTWGQPDTPWAEQIDVAQNVDAGVDSVIPSTGLAFGLRDDFAGTSLADRPEQQTGVYDTGESIWSNAYFRPSWAPETSGTYQMDSGTIIVRGVDAEIRAPAPHATFDSGFRFAIDASHDRNKGRMRATLGYTDSNGNYTPCVSMSNNSGNENLRAFVYEQEGEYSSIFNATTSTGTGWQSWELTYSNGEWAFKKDGATRGIARSYGGPWTTPNTIILENTAYDGEGGRWKDLKIDSQVSQ